MNCYVITAACWTLNMWGIVGFLPISVLVRFGVS